MMWWPILVAVVVGIPRPLGVKTQAYQAVAHLYMGGAITLWYLYREPLWMWIVLGLSTLEVACFLYFKIQEKHKLKETR